MMAKRTIKNLGRRGLALFLSLVMMTSLLQLTAFATGEESVVPENNAQQIEPLENDLGYAYYGYDEANGFASSGTQGAIVYNNDEHKDVMISKTITPTEYENIFDITLNVETNQTVEKNTTYPNAAVVLVLDASTSMLPNHNNGVDVLQKAKIAAQEFVDKFATNSNGAERQVAVVTFNTGVHCISDGWVDVTNDTARNTLKQKIANVTTFSSTNTHGGLLMAQNLLKSINKQSFEYRYVILMTDGIPNALTTVEDVQTGNEYEGSWYGARNGEYSDPWKTEPLYKGVNWYEHEDFEATLNEKKGWGDPYKYAAYRAGEKADELKDDGVVVYSVGYGDALTSQIYDSIYSYSGNQTGRQWLKSVCTSPNHFFEAENADDLTVDFQAIVNEITVKAGAWMVTDPMGSNIILDEDSLDNVVGAHVTDSGLQWNLRQANSIKNGDKTTYTMTYQVKLDNTAKGFNPDAFYKTNGATSLTYYIKVNDKFVDNNHSEIPATETEKALMTMYFKVPAVQGYLANLSFTKVDENNAALVGAKFTLSGANGFSQEASSGSDGKVTFTNIPSGYTYTLTESEAPDGYIQNDKEYTVTVSYGEVSVDGVNNLDNFQITNNPILTHAITATKVVNGATLTENQFSFQLLNDQGEVLQTKTNAADGTVTFDAIEYTTAGTFVYTVKEVIPDSVPANWTYDNSEYKVAVTVASNDGALSKTVTTEKLGETNETVSEIRFANSYEEPVGSLKIDKTSNNTTLIPGTTIFTITNDHGYSNTVQYADFNHKAEGYHEISGLSLGNYTVTETGAGVAGYELSVEANGASGNSATVSVVQNGTATVAFANNYTQLPPTAVQGAFSINFSKGVAGDDYTMNGNNFAFTLTNTADSTDTYTAYNVTGGNVSISPSFEVDLANVTGNTATETFTYMLSEQAGSVEGMTYSTAQYTVTVPVNFSRTSRLAPWTWSLGEVTVTNDAVAAVNEAAITLTLNNSALFVNNYDKPEYTGTLTIKKVIAGDLTDAEKTELANKLDFVVNKVFDPQPYGGGGNAYILYTSMTDGAWVMNDQKPGTYTVTENDATMAGYNLTTTWTVTGTESKTVTDSSAQVALKAGDDITVTITNTYSKVPVYTYYVQHEYFYKENGGEWVPQGKNTPAPYTITTVAPPSEATVFDAQEGSEEYNNRTYAKAGVYADAEVDAPENLPGALLQGNLVYTVKYYASGWTAGSLTINKSFDGLDDDTLVQLKKNLSFTVTGPEGSTFSETIKYSDFNDGNKHTIIGLVPGEYTIMETGAEVGGGYDLIVTADDVNAEKPGYQINVTAGASAVTFDIENSYTGRVYNIWFDGGEHGSVEEGVYRNRWQKFHGDKKEGYAWGGRVLNPTVGDKPSDTIYELDDRYDPKTYIYKTVTEDTDYTIDEILSAANNTDGMIMYTLTWAQWVKYSEEMGFSKPSLSVEKGWTSDKQFYHNGGTEKFESIANTIAYMNEYINGSNGASPADESAVLPVYVDENGFYHIYYVAKYSQYHTPTSNLTINKTATGADVPAGATFTISGTTVDKEAYSTSFTYQDMSNGTKTITIPVGSYTVTESGASVSGYSLTTTVDYGAGATVATVAEGETAVVAITNTYSYNGGGNGGGGGHKPSVIIEEEEPPLAELPDEEPPLAELPDEEPPLAELPEEEVPLALAPMTGDTTALYALSVLGSAMGLMYLWLTGKKREEDA